MGDWVYYVTYLRFRDIYEWVSATKQIYNGPRLTNWIDNRITRFHASEAMQCLIGRERFSGAIILGVYGGSPSWAELRVSDPRRELTDDEGLELRRSIGFLRFSGTERLIAIDGRHRVAGIKRAVEKSIASDTDEVTAILVAHKNTKEGMARTRRLFTTLHKTAKKVSPADIVALDEDNSFAVVTRRLVDECPIFVKSNIVSYAATSALPESDETHVTSVIGLYEIVQDLYPRNREGWRSRTAATRSRLENGLLDKLYALNESYWQTLVKEVTEYRLVIEERTKTARDFRSHLLFRPVGQRAFAGAVQVLMGRDVSLNRAIRRLLAVEMNVTRQLWWYVLWNPIDKTILWKGRNRSAAETLLLREIGEEPRNDTSALIFEDVLKRRQEALGSRKRS